MADYLLVRNVPGPTWDHSKGRREQAGWDAHASFMDALAAEGFVVLGGPVGAGDATTRCSSCPHKTRLRRGRALPTTRGRTPS